MSADPTTMMKLALQKVLAANPQLMRKENSRDLFTQLKATLQQFGFNPQASMAAGMSTSTTAVRFLPGDSRERARRLPGKQVLMNGKVEASAVDTRTWVNLKIPESDGAAGVTIIYGRLASHPEYTAGNNTSCYAAILPYRLTSDPGASWVYTTEPYCLGGNALWDDGAGTTAVFSAGLNCKRAQPLVVRRDDIDGNYYVSILFGSGAYSQLMEVMYHIRARVFRFPDDPLIKGKVPLVGTLPTSSVATGPSTIGGLPAEGGLDVGGLVVQPAELTKPLGLNANTLLQIAESEGKLMTPELAQEMKKVLGL